MKLRDFFPQKAGNVEFSSKYQRFNGQAVDLVVFFDGHFLIAECRSLVYSALSYQKLHRAEKEGSAVSALRVQKRRGKLCPPQKASCSSLGVKMLAAIGRTDGDQSENH